VKYLLIFFISTNAYCWSLNFLLDGEKYYSEELIFQQKISPNLPTAKSALTQGLLDKILNDKEGLVGSDFKIPEYFKPNVYFWFSVYTQYSSHQVLIHDKEDLDIVYKVLDFNELRQKTNNLFLRMKLQSDMAMEEALKIKRHLVALSRDINTPNIETRKIFRLIKAVKDIPESESGRKEFFKSLALKVRTQTGQREIIHKGVINSLPYLPFLEYHFKSFELPHEMLAIAFLESSFNPKARSRVNAAGAWQIMPLIASKMTPYKKRLLDSRLSPIISSITAFHLLKENYSILKRWDLAVTAYNSGALHLIKAKKQLGKDFTHSLENIFKHYKSDHHGFASKNFYSEFLALVHVLAYKDIIYPLKGTADYLNSQKENHTNIYISKCKITPKKFFNMYQHKSNILKDMNTHFLKPNRRYNAGNLVIADFPLQEKKFYKLSDKQLRRKWPINWKKYPYGRCK
jgi:membrane-bound lytic murein transglycosylase D